MVNYTQFIFFGLYIFHIDITYGSRLCLYNMRDDGIVLFTFLSKCKLVRVGPRDLNFEPTAKILLARRAVCESVHRSGRLWFELSLFFEHRHRRCSAHVLLAMATTRAECKKWLINYREWCHVVSHTVPMRRRRRNRAESKCDSDDLC